MNVLITTVPFGDKNSKPIDLLEKNLVNYVINPFNKKLTEDELITLVKDIDVIIAGTEKISSKVMASAPNLKFISRVGIGLDSVDLVEARNRNIKVSYTPDAPSPAVAELTIGLMISLLRSIHVVNSKMHCGNWERIFGKRLSELTIGIIGMGRIGNLVLEKLSSFNCKKVLLNDLKENATVSTQSNIQWTDKQTIYKMADLITLHLPLTKDTKNMITKKELSLMKSDACIINTSRGGIINEDDLYNKLINNPNFSAAIDVFNLEPYNGPLREINRCLLTSHMGSMSVDCRSKMEIEATEEAIRFIKSEQLQNEVPDEEYDVQRAGL